MSAAGIPLYVPVTSKNFDEGAYLASNPDVAALVGKGALKSGRHHFDTYGYRENRQIRSPTDIADVQRQKIENLKPLLKLDMPHARRGDKYDFLTEDLRKFSGIVETNAISCNGYDDFAVGMIEEFSSGWVLDCGAGRRSIYYPNVVNLEIVDYESTDILGIGEALPFVDGAFDGIISIAVLEHVKHPFACADEIVRVLKPGGKLICCVPFLQPLHGYPHHYYNMSGQGLRALFEGKLAIDDHQVIDSIKPIWTLTWFVQSWAQGLTGKTRDQFLKLRLRDLLVSPLELLDRPWVTQLSAEKNFELASATILFAHKPHNPLVESTA